MKKIFTREAKIGIVVIIAIAMLYFGINFLKGINIFKPNTYFYAQYERIDGIVKTTPVLINGYQVGHVSDINFDYTKEAPITLEITVDKKLVVPKGTVAQIYDTGIMGDKAIQLNLGSSPTPCATGDTLDTSVQNGLMAAIAEAIGGPVEAMMPQLDSTLRAVRGIVQDENIKKILANTATATASLSSASEQLNGMMKEDIPAAVKDIKKVANNLTTVTDGLQDVDWKKTANKVDSTIDNLETLTQKLKSKDNNLGLLLNDKAIYNQLDSTIQSANALLIDLKANPKKYVHFSVFGKKDKKEKDNKAKEENTKDDKLKEEISK